MGSDPRILFVHILPNVLGSVIVVATLQVGRMILAEASLSFLGLGVQPPHPAWGTMVADGGDVLESAWWISTLPGLAILTVVLGINMFGDWLRDALDPTPRIITTSLVGEAIEDISSPVDGAILTLGSTVLMPVGGTVAQIGVEEA